MLVSLYVIACAGIVLGWCRLPTMLLVALPLAAGLTARLHTVAGIGEWRALGDFVLLLAVAQIAWGLTYVLVRRRETRGVQ